MPSMKAALLQSPRSVDDVFAALLQVAQDSSYTFDGVSNEVREAIFRSGKSALSWGHLYIASVVPDGDGAALQLTTAIVPGAPKALMDGRKNQKAGATLIEAVEALLSSGSAPTPRSTPSFATLPDGTTVPWTAGDFPGAGHA